MVGGHDALRIDALIVHQPKPKLPLSPTAAGPFQAWRQIALQRFLREWSAMAQQAQTLLPINDDGAPAIRIASAARERLRHRITCQHRCISRRHGRHCDGQHQACQKPRCPHARLRSACLSGKSRTRLPVAAKIAFSTAGAATAIVGSPTPPQKPPDCRMMVSTFGISFIRSTW